MKNAQEKKLTVVINAIETAGYNPYAQLTGYMATGDASYITRQGGARTMIRELDETLIKCYLAEHSRMHLR